MERLAQDCVNVFCELSGYSKDRVGMAPTPLLDEANDPLLVLEEHVSSPPQGGTAGKSKNTPPPQGGAVNAVGTGSGKLSKIVCKVLMKILYIARLARSDLLRAVGALSTMITKWDSLCDRKLFRIIRYINGSTGWRQIGFIGDGPDEPEFGLLSDADFAGDREAMRSTSSVFLALLRFPLAAQSKKHTAVSHSTVEAEIVAADHAIRMSGLPALPLWERLLDRTMSLEVYRDNQATTRIMTTGRAPTLRHGKRTHCVSISWLNERVLGPDISLHDRSSEAMAADIFKNNSPTGISGSMCACQYAFAHTKQLNTIAPRLAQVRSPACVATSAPRRAMSLMGTDIPALPSQEGALDPTAAERLNQAPITPPLEHSPTAMGSDAVALPSQEGPTLQ
jgi:hypothetical protein